MNNDFEVENEDATAENAIEKRRRDLLNEIVEYLDNNSINYNSPDIEGENISDYNSYDGYDTSDYQFHFNDLNKYFMYTFDNHTGNILDIDTDLKKESKLYKDLNKIIGYRR